MQEMTPRQIVSKLDQFIIGQDDAKRAVAVAIRNRWRRRQLDDAMAQEVYPKNIVMIGPTGVGKTEIARRLASLAQAPFVKVEASKFTEVGYHGRDVESMIRDLVDQAVSMVRAEQAEQVKQKAEQHARDALLDKLLPGFGQTGAGADVAGSSGAGNSGSTMGGSGGASGGASGGVSVGGSDSGSLGLGGSTGYVSDQQSQQRRQQVRDRLAEQLDSGALEEREIELTISQKPATSVMFANMGLDQMDPEMSNVFERLIPEQSQTRRVTVAQARQILIEQETEKLLDREKITSEAITRAQQDGIVFLDEIDKIATASGGEGGRSGGSGSPDVSRQGVQRDLLPIVEGSAVTTRHGVVYTDHILFIAAGAFHTARISDLMPELQGRFPIRVELTALTQADFVRILTEPDNALTKQQQALLAVEGMTVVFDEGAIDAVAELAARANQSLENIGARRLMTIVEKVFEQVNFEAPDMVQQGEKELRVTDSFVREQVAAILEDEDLSRFVL